MVHADGALERERHSRKEDRVRSSGSTQALMLSLSYWSQAGQWTC